MSYCVCQLFTSRRGKDCKLERERLGLTGAVKRVLYRFSFYISNKISITGK